MKYIIKDNKFEINIDEKLTKIKKENLIQIYCYIRSLIILEKDIGNEIDKAWIQIKYQENILITEYINIFKLIRKGTYSDFVEFFRDIEKKYSKQNIDTKMNIDCYIEELENYTQKIQIKMVFKITTEETLINNRKKKNGRTSFKRY